MMRNPTRYRRLLLGVVALSLLSLLFAACGGDPTATSAPTAAPTMAPTAVPATAMPGSTAAPTARPTAVPATPTPSFDAEAYFKGKTIRMMVGYNPGGGTDAQARFMARAWQEYIPGKPRIIVTNMVPNLTQRNFVWKAKPDGLTISVEAVPGVFDQLVDQAEWDMRKVSMIGVTSGRDAVWFIRGTMPYDCFNDAFGATGPTITLGTAAPTPADLGSQVAPLFLALEFDMPLEVINVAAAGSAEQYLMIERGDTNSWYTSTVWYQLPKTRPGWTTEKFIRGFADMSYPGYRLTPNTEAAFPCKNPEEFLNDEQKKVWSAITGPRTIMSKNVIGPPDMEPNVLKALRDALTAAMNNADFAEKLEGFTGIPNNFTPGEIAQEELIQTTQDFLDNRAVVDDVQARAFAKFVR